MSYKPNYDYSKTLWMKMFLANPDFTKNTSDVKITFEQALEIIKKIDNITQGLQKIVYLVGWQRLGHDDGYPIMEVVNDHLKRDCDATGKESLLWLFEEAKKFNTVISYHGNLADCYCENETFPEFAEAKAVVCDKDSKPTPIEIFNGRDGYKISYKHYYDSGLFKKYWDRFCEAVPVREAGTVHLDNFCIAESINPRATVEEQDEARNKMLDYIASLGIDVTTEYTYREDELRSEDHYHPIRRFYEANGLTPGKTKWSDMPIRALGRIPGAWWMSNMTAQDCIDISPAVYSGRLTDGSLRNVFYGAMHGEDIWLQKGIDPKVWVPIFINQYLTEQVPYQYLNRYERKSIEQLEDGSYIGYWSDGIVSYGSEHKIVKNGIILKDKNDLILPLTDDNKTFVAYSEEGKNGEWNMPDAEFTKAAIYEITENGNIFIENKEITDKKICLNIKPGQAFAIKAIK